MKIESIKISDATVGELAELEKVFGRRLTPTEFDKHDKTLGAHLDLRDRKYLEEAKENVQDLITKTVKFVKEILEKELLPKPPKPEPDSIDSLQISTKTASILKKHGFKRITQLIHARATELIIHKGLGRKSLADIKKALKEKGHTLPE